ncbi:MAG: carboxypeptidase-like regulatory domain-containing protein [Thermoanaerobaculia bacterium]
MRVARALLLASIVAGSATQALSVSIHVELRPAGPATAGTLIARPLEGGPPVRIALTELGAELPLAKGTWQITGELPGRYVEPTTLSVTSGAERVVIRAWRTGSVRGEVVAATEGGVPELLELRWSSVSPDGPPPGFAACQVAERRWRCEMPAGKAMDLRVRASGFLTLFKWGVDVEPERALDWGTVKLQRGASVFGWVGVARRAEARMNDVRVILSTTAATPSVVAAVTPDRRGFFRFAGIAPAPYRLEATAPGPLASEKLDVIVKPNEESELLAELKLEPLHSVRVTIVPATPENAPRWHLSLLSFDRVQKRSDTVAKRFADFTGMWESPGLRPGSYVALIGPNEESVLARREIEVSRDDENILIDVNQTKVRGRVQLGDRPLEASVWVGGKRRQPTVKLQAGEDGSFEGYVPFTTDSEWLVTIDADHPRVETTLLRKPEVEDDGTTRLDVSLPAAGVRGRVIDEKGGPVPLAIVNIATPDPLVSVLQSATDDAGEFELSGLRAGTYSADATSRDLRRSRTTPFLVPEEGQVDVTLTVEPQGTITGRVLVQGLPVTGATVVLLPTNVAVTLWPQATTKTQGAFAIGLPTATTEVNLMVSAPGLAFKAFRIPLPKEPIAIALETNGGTLDFDALPFVDSEAAEQTFVIHRGAEVNAQYLAYLGNSSIRTGGPGRLRVVHPLMDPGVYSVCRAMMADRPALRAGALPTGRCATGVLAPWGTLRLELPMAEGPSGSDRR